MIASSRPGDGSIAADVALTVSARLVLVACTSVSVAAAAVVLAAAPGELVKSGGPHVGNAVAAALSALCVAGVATVGAVLAVRRPRHPISWLFVALGPLLGFIVGVWSYRWPTPVGFEIPYLYASLVGSFLVVGLAGPGLALLFPDGRLPSSRWNLPVALLTGVFAVSGALLCATPGSMEDFVPPGSPGAGPGAGIRALEPFEGLLAIGAYGGLIALGVASVLAILVRRRTGGPVVRAQLRWFLVASALLPLGVAGSIVEAAFIPEGSGVPATVILLGLVLTPIAVAIAILRYRLYDIDVVIRRTLVYGAVVAILGALYVGLVLASQALLSAATGGDALPVAISTLAIVALFGPVRARVRAAVDRRFYRTGYDAAGTLERLTVRLRDEVELDAVAAALVDVAARTVRPASIGVWLRGTADPGGRGRSTR